MIRQYHLQGLTCPNCAALIEQETGTLPQVTQAQMNLMTQTLTLHTLQDTQLDTAVTAIVKNHEPTVNVVPGKRGTLDEAPEGPDGRHLLYIGGGLFALGLLAQSFLKPLWLAMLPLVAAYLVTGLPVLKRAGRNILRGQVFDENFLMGLSTLGAFAIGEVPEAVAVMLFYQVGEYFQARAIRKSKRSIAGLISLRPDFARLLTKEGDVLLPPDEVQPGDILQVKPGERIPLDGVVLEGFSTLDTAMLTGESKPRRVQPGEEVAAGCVNLRGVLRMQVSRAEKESTVQRIIDMVEHAAQHKAPTENFITAFARRYTPVVVLLAALLMLVPPLVFQAQWAVWVHRAFVFLVISCPCALVVSIPMGFFAGIGKASRQGILMKGSNYLEALAAADTVVFDKTGTLTKGVFEVTNLSPGPGFTKESLLHLAAQAEQHSSHPMALAIRKRAGDIAAAGTDHKETPGQGVQAVVEGKQVWAGNARWLQGLGVTFQEEHHQGSQVYVAMDGQYVGAIAAADAPKEGSAEAIKALKKLGIRRVVMLTGDLEQEGRRVGQQLGLDQVYAQLLPENKVEHLERLMQDSRGKTVFLGDGINDAPVLRRADVGVAMGRLGADAAIEAADVVLMTDEVGKLAEAITIARQTLSIVRQNIWLSLGVKGIFLLLGALGIAGMWEAVFADVGITMLAVLNALRLLRK